MTSAYVTPTAQAAADLQGATARYFRYPTQSDTEPTLRGPTRTGDAQSSAYNTANTQVIGVPTVVGTNGRPSAYGTYDQTGNVWEWTDSNTYLNLAAAPTNLRFNKKCRGGSYQIVLRTALRFPANITINLTPTSNSLAARYVFWNLGLAATEPDVGFRIVRSTETDAPEFSSVNALVGPFVTVGDPGNAATEPIAPESDPNLQNITKVYGGVANSFKLQTYTVTNAQYCAFLNSAAKTDPYGLYNTNMASQLQGGILRSGASGEFVYTVKTFNGNAANLPVNFVSWLSAARFCNWLHNGATSEASTETGAYTLNGNTVQEYNANPGARYRLPTDDEWYKAAYYRGGGLNAGYWDFATQSNVTPAPVDLAVIGSGNAGKNENSGNFAGFGIPITAAAPAAVGTTGGPSYYGTYNQGDNVRELVDDPDEYPGRARGGSCVRSATMAEKSYPGFGSILLPIGDVGLRVATLTNEYNFPNFVRIGNPGNAPDVNNRGGVEYEYYIGKYEVTTEEYVDYLNATAKQPVSLPSVIQPYEPIMSANIQNYLPTFARFGGPPGEYTYLFPTNYRQVTRKYPIEWLNWLRATLYCNWLHHNKPSGPSSSTTILNGAYRVRYGRLIAASRTNNVTTYTTSAPHNLIVGDPLYMDTTSAAAAEAAWRAEFQLAYTVIQSTPTPTTFTVAHTKADAPTTATGSAVYVSSTRRLPGAKYFIPSTDEWYKAAYYCPVSSAPKIYVS